MLTATTAAAGDRPGQISVHRVRPEGWVRPTCAILGSGPWLRRAWSPQPNLPQLARAYALHLGQLDALKVWDLLHRLADGHAPVLVNDGWPSGPNVLVRRMAAAWFHRELGEEVRDLNVPGRSLVDLIGVDPWAS